MKGKVCIFATWSSSFECPTKFPFLWIVSIIIFKKPKYLANTNFTALRWNQTIAKINFRKSSYRKHAYCYLYCGSIFSTRWSRGWKIRAKLSTPGGRKSINRIMQSGTLPEVTQNSIPQAPASLLLCGRPQIYHSIQR